MLLFQLQVVANCTISIDVYRCIAMFQVLVANALTVLNYKLKCLYLEEQRHCLTLPRGVGTGKFQRHPLKATVPIARRANRINTHTYTYIQNTYTSFHSS